MRSRILTAFLLAVFVLCMTGCTPEKAEALLTAVKSFVSLSTAALNAYEDLFKEYASPRAESLTEISAKAYEAVKANKQVTFEEVASRVGSLSRERRLKKIETQFEELKSAYDLLSDAYASLPEGSLFGAKYVSCGQTAVAKLTMQLVNFATDVDQDPLYPLALRKDFEAYKVLVEAGPAQEEKAKLRFGAIATEIVEYEKKHKEAIAKTVAAVQQGRNLVKLMGRYDEVTLSSILGVVETGLAFAGTLKGLDVSKPSAKLKAIKEEMDSESYWKRVSEIPLTNVADCRLPQAK